MISQKGILLGLFVEPPSVIEMDPMSITVYGTSRKEEEPEKKDDEPEKKDDESGKKDDDPKNTNKNTSGWNWLHGLYGIFSFLIITCCCRCGYKICCEKSKANQDFVYLSAKMTVTSYDESYD